MQFWAWNWMPPGDGSLWIFPLVGVALIVFMAFACMRIGATSWSGCMGGRASDRSGEAEDSRGEDQELRKEIRRLYDQR